MKMSEVRKGLMEVAETLWDMNEPELGDRVFELAGETKRRKPLRPRSKKE